MEQTSQTSRTEFGLESHGLNLWYGDFQALRDVSIQIKDGIITGLIGPSGCGKTTFLRCFNRINERYGNVTISGEVRVLDKNIYDDDVCLPELRRAVGMVFQRPNPLPLSVYDNVVFGLKVHSPPRSLKKAQLDEAVETALREVFLWDDLKGDLRILGTSLQLEQQQKLCIARLLPLKPKVILMDEPCSALDAEGTQAVEDLMGTLRKRYTILIVTHNMAQARRVTDECIYMLNGEMVEASTTEDLFLNPHDERTEAYIEGRYG